MEQTDIYRNKRLVDHRKGPHHPADAVVGPEFCETEEFFSSWNPDLSGIKTPEPTSGQCRGVREDEEGEDEEALYFENGGDGGAPSEYDMASESSAIEEVTDQQIREYSNGATFSSTTATDSTSNNNNHVWVPPAAVPSPPAMQQPSHHPSISPGRSPDRGLPLKEWKPRRSGGGGISISGESAAVAPRRAKKTKAKSGPQRPLSAYNLFFRDYRQFLIRDTGGSVPFVTMGKEVGKKWKSLNSRERLVWEQRAEEESNRYREELLAFKENNKKRRFGYVHDLSTACQAKPDELREACSEGPLNRGCIPQAEVSRGEGMDLATIESLEGSAYRCDMFFHPSCPNRSNNENFVMRSFNPGQLQQAAHEDPSNQGLGPASYWRGPPQGWHQQELVDLTLPAKTTMTPFSRAREVLNLPQGFTFPEGVPPSGTEMFLPDSTGALRPHRLSWKLYSLAEDDAEAFMAQFKESGGEGG